MSKITNKSKSTLILGRFKVLPGQALPAVPYTVREKKDIKHFIEKGMLATSDGKLPDFLMEKKEAADAAPVTKPVVEAPVAEVAVETVPEPATEPTPEPEANQDATSEVTPEAAPEAAPETTRPRRNRK